MTGFKITNIKSYMPIPIIINGCTEIIPSKSKSKILYMDKLTQELLTLKNANVIKIEEI